ncbi:MAG: imidazole glycerol phosphate synthase subunit HisH [Candidatus Omnitrophica bacterium]|nr:imidazole glycerol phosphate synthase subunit HisH [Candidatus Omnitrophota bacterium]
MKLDGTIGVIDYGMGNLRSVSKAIERLGGSVYVGSNPAKLDRAKKLILPGVGAFGDAMQELKKRNLISLIKKAAQQGKPLLGVCLGLQLFFERSAESPSLKGLGIWKGSVVRFKNQKRKKLKIPHMGWNQVRFKKPKPFISGVKNNDYFYFVHSFYAQPKNKDLIVGETDYGVRFPSVLASRNIFAVQFHPEKSQRAGLRILKNFICL